MARDSVGEIALDLSLNSNGFKKQLSGIADMAKRGCRTIKYFLLGGSPALCPNGGEIGCDFAPSLINTVHSQTSLSACLI